MLNISARLAASSAKSAAPKATPAAPKLTRKVALTSPIPLASGTAKLGFNPIDIIKGAAIKPAPKPAPQPTRREIPSFSHQNQYTNNQSNACGTTSLSMLMNYHNPGKAANNRNTIDNAIRNGDMFTAPDDVVGYARKNGYKAEIKNDASFSDIQSMLDKGLPVEVLIDPGSTTDFNLHYITVTGYEKDAAGNITKVIVNDPAKNGRTELSYDDFMGKWSDLKMGGIPTGMNRVMMTICPNDNRTIVGLDGVSRKAKDISLPKDPWGRMFSDALPAQTLGKGWLDLVNGYKNKDAGKIAHGLANLAASLGPVLLNSLVGLPAQAAGQAMKDWGSKKMAEGGLGAIIGAAAIVMGEFTQKMGWAVSKLSAIATWTNDKILSTLVGAGEAIVNGVVKGATAVADFAAGAANTAWEGLKSVGGFVKKVFSGW
jgi:uncharacterized protein YvpB